MAFKENGGQQISLDDSFLNLTERERNAFEKSWAKIFADEIFRSLTKNVFLFFIVTKHPDLILR